ncbi:MAG: hypothetical protein GC159_16915 [Phycisphaera sp.]|nr:hypothetical protein [Phycisphaera sp.]
MASTTIALGNEQRVARLYSYPNDPTNPGAETLSDTVLHWTNQTLERDGVKAKGVTASVSIDGDNYAIVLEGPDGTQSHLDLYADRIPQFFKHGEEAMAVIEQVKTMKKDPPWPDWAKSSDANCKWNPNALWDPQGTNQWYFFLPMGMAMIHQKSLQFFHYPPVRLLTSMRDYLDDPVPVRWVELLEANGVATEQDAWLYSTVMDGAPIAAPDDQGTIYPPEGQTGQAQHLIPIQHFHDYQLAQVNLLLNTFPGNDKYTVPIVVYGTPARDTFNALYKVELSIKKNPTITLEIIPGKTTPVICVGHPYRFYAQAQSYVGSGSIVPGECADAVEIMKEDLVVARWQHLMAQDPTQDPKTVLADCNSYWRDDAHAATVCKLVRHEGSLWYPDPNSLEFQFKVSLDEAAAICQKNNNQTCEGLS